jgi:hypothetical protein
MSEAARRRWRHVEVQDVVRNIVDVVKGDVARLFGSPRARRSVWGIIALNMFDINTLVDRFWLHVIFIDDVNNARVS